MQSGTNAQPLDAIAALRESEEQFRTAFHVAPIGLAMLNAEERITAANASLCEMLGFDADELVGRSWTELLHGSEREGGLTDLKQMLFPGQDRLSIETRFDHKQRHTLWCVLSIAVVRNSIGDAMYYVAQILDTTAAKSAERRLAQYAEELERSNQELEQLASVVSHDLQAPLRTLRGYVQLLVDEYSRALDEQGVRWASYVMAGADRMHVLIGDLLKVARVQAHSSPVAPTDLMPVANRAWDRIQLVFEPFRPELTCDPLPNVAVDEIQIEQVFQNLFDNAVKYRRRDVSPRVRVRVTRNAEEWQFSVSDNGIGIDMSQADRIFDIFQRLHPDHEYDGTGIGLAVCRKIIERHRGRIWVESMPGEGATFHFTIPDIRWQDPAV